MKRKPTHTSTLHKEMQKVFFRKSSYINQTRVFKRQERAPNGSLTLAVIMVLKSLLSVMTAVHTQITKSDQVSEA